MNIRKIKRVWWYLEKFGLVHGTTILLKTASKKDFAQADVPGYSYPVFFRRNTSDVDTFDQVIVGEEYDYPFPNPNPQLIIDAGANAGYATIFLAQKFPKAQIIAVEPDPDNFSALTRNTERYSNIKVIQAGLWPRSTNLKIKDVGADKWAIQVTETDTADADTIKAVTIPDLMKMAGSERIDILKIDIETAEKELFETGYELWLDKVDVLMIELHDNLRPGCSTSFYRATSKYQFKQSVIGENVILERY